jgi:hypothetical protein
MNYELLCLQFNLAVYYKFIYIVIRLVTVSAGPRRKRQCLLGAVAPTLGNAAVAHSHVVPT